MLSNPGKTLQNSPKAKKGNITFLARFSCNTINSEMYGYLYYPRWSRYYTFGADVGVQTYILPVVRAPMR